MVRSVNGVFNEFLQDTVNLSSSVTERARKSRNWLIGQIDNFNKKDDFPALYSDINIYFGSFARKTKIRELDDIDIMIGLSGQDSFYTENKNRTEIIISESSENLNNLCFEDTNKLNSRKVINQFVSNFSDIPQYSEAEIKRNQEAATLKLNSYPWNFDIVPCFMTKENEFGDSYYLIPDGVCFAIEKYIVLQRKVHNVATQYFPFNYSILDKAFFKR